MITGVDSSIDSTLLDPFLGGFTLARWLAAFLLGTGGVRLFIAYNFRGARGARSVASMGVVELILGLVLISGLPGAGREVLGLFLGMELLLGGTCMVNIYRTARSLESRA